MQTRCGAGGQRLDLIISGTITNFTFPAKDIVDKFSYSACK